MDRQQVLSRNRESWNAQVAKGNRWTIPVSSDAINQARTGHPEIVLTPCKKVPQSWFPNLKDCRTLMLASGGGQQSPIMAAAGADVTVLDISDSQLEQDRHVAEREGLQLKTVQGSMDDLACFENESFDLIIHPCSNSFIPELAPVWKEAARVLRLGGHMMSGFCNPLIFLFDDEAIEEGTLSVANSLPYSDEKSLSSERLQALAAADEPLMFGHTLTSQLGGQMNAGLAIVDMYEDSWGTGGDGAGGDDGYSMLDQYTQSFLATLSRKLK